jgi:hypothetical protein
MPRPDLTVSLLTLADAVALHALKFRSENSHRNVPTAVYSGAVEDYTKACQQWPAMMATAAAVFALTYASEVNVATATAAIVALNVNNG